MCVCAKKLCRCAVRTVLNNLRQNLKTLWLSKADLASSPPSVLLLASASPLALDRKPTSQHSGSIQLRVDSCFEILLCLSYIQPQLPAAFPHAVMPADLPVPRPTLLCCFTVISLTRGMALSSLSAVFAPVVPLHSGCFIHKTCLAQFAFTLPSADFSLTYFLCWSC